MFEFHNKSIWQTIHAMKNNFAFLLLHIPSTENGHGAFNFTALFINLPLHS